MGDFREIQQKQLETLRGLCCKIDNLNGGSGTAGGSLEVTQQLVLSAVAKDSITNIVQDTVTGIKYVQVIGSNSTTGTYTAPIYLDSTGAVFTAVNPMSYDLSVLTDSVINEKVCDIPAVGDAVKVIKKYTQDAAGVETLIGYFNYDGTAYTLVGTIGSCPSTTSSNNTNGTLADIITGTVKVVPADTYQSIKLMFRSGTVDVTHGNGITVNYLPGVWVTNSEYGEKLTNNITYDATNGGIVSLEYLN